MTASETLPFSAINLRQIIYSYSLAPLLIRYLTLML